MKMIGFVLTALLSATMCVSANDSKKSIVLPSLGDRSSSIVSQQEEFELGRLWLMSLRRQTHTVADPELKFYFENLTKRLAAASEVTDHRFALLIINNPALNAFAAPGGVIGVNTGLFMQAKTEAQFAAVLAHELAHLSQRHFARNVESAKEQQLPTVAAILGSILIMATAGGEAGSAALSSTMAGVQHNQLRFSRQFEYEADNLGIATLTRAGFDPQAMPDVFEQMGNASRYSSKPPEFLLTHPVTENRIASSRTRADQLSRPTGKGAQNDSFEYQLMRIRATIASHPDIHPLVQNLKKTLAANDGKNTLADHYALALASMETQDYALASKHLEEAITRAPNSINLQITKAQLAIKTGHAAQAIKQLEHALATQPDHFPLQATYVEALRGAGQLQKAQETLTQLARNRPLDPDIWYELAELQGLNGNIVGLHQSRAEYFFLTGNPEEAIKHLTFALAQVDSKKNYALHAKLQHKLLLTEQLRQKLHEM